MAKTTSQYLNYSLQSLIVSTLEKDGAFCNFFSKNYDEQATYDGGTGFRLSFNEYNNQIIKFHTLLKILTGEQRANIRESIPVIDFLNTKNTSLLYTYEMKGKKVDTTSIRAASTEETTALDLILNEDPFIINRAIAGETVAEHFYNTTGNGETPNLQTSPWLGNNYVEYLYKGIYDSALIVNGKELESSILKSSFYAFESTTSGSGGLSDIYDSGTSYIQFTSNTSSDKNISLRNKLLKKDIRGIISPEEFDSIVDTTTGDEDPYAINGVTFLTKLEKDSTYQIELNEEDICLLIPKSVGLSGLATLLVLKKDDSVASMAESSLTWASYKIYNYTEGTFGPVVGGLTDLENVPKGALYHLIDYPNNAFSISAEEPSTTSNPAPIPDSLQVDVDVVCKEDIENSTDNGETKWAVAGSYYKAFYIPISSYTSSKIFNEIKINESLPGYLQRTGVYDRVTSFLNIDKVYTSKASGLLSGFYESPYKRDNIIVSSEGEIPSTSSKVTLWKFANDVDKAKEKGVAIEVGSKYFKGHLLGRGVFDDSPLKLTSHDLVNGKIPTRRDGTPYKGKILLTYDKLKNAASDLFNKVKVDDFNNFPIKSIDDVVTRADYEGRTYSASEVKNLLSNEELNRTSSTSNLISYQSILNYPSKLNALNSSTEGNLVSDSEQIIQYFNNILSGLKSTGTNEYELNLDLTDESGPCVSKKMSYQKVTVKTELPIYETKEHCGKTELVDSGKTHIQEIVNTKTTVDLKGGNIGDIYTTLDKNYEVLYEVNLVDVNQEDIEKAQRGEISLGDINAQKGDAFNFKIKLISPLEVFSTKNKYLETELVDVNRGGGTFSSDYLLPSSKRIVPTGTILVYPEYSKYLPNTMFLLSSEDLNLEEYGSSSTHGTRSMVSFLAKRDNKKPNSVVSYKVSSVKSFKPSQIKKVRLKTGDNKYEEISYPYGLYPNYKVNTIKAVSGFETIKVSTLSSKVTNSQGYEFDFGALVRGEYVKGREEITYEAYNYGKTSEVSNSNSLLKSNAKIKSALRLSALQTDLSLAENTQEEEETSSTTDVNLTSNLLTSRETSSTKNAEDTISTEKEIASRKDTYSPGTGIAYGTNTKIVRGKNRSKNTFETVDSTLSFSENNISMGGDSTPSEITVSGISWYRTYQECSSYWVTTGEGDGEQVYREYMVNVPLYTTTYTYVPSVGTSYDCYIYTLEFMQLNLDDIDIYDQNDQEIKLSDFSDVKLVPMSYPPNFFAVSTKKDNNNLPIYELNNKSDVSTLKDRLIIPGLPQFTTKEDLLTTNTRSINLEPIANMIFAGDSSTAKALDSILGNAIYSILKTWKLSGIDDNNSTQNPLLLEDLPSLVEGLVSAESVLEELGDDAFTINLGEEEYTITASDVNGLIYRINNDDYHYKVKYNIDYTEPSNKSDDYLTHITETGFDDNGEAFITELRKRLQKVSVVGEVERDLARPSLKRLSTYVSTAFSSSDALDENLCKILDSYFGNDTIAFLKLGDSSNMSLSVEGSTYSMGSFKDVYATGSQLIDKMAEVILNMSNTARDALLSKKLEAKLEKMKECFKPYYTEASINENIKATSYEDILSSVNNPNLVLNVDSFEDDRIRSLLQLIKDNYNSKHLFSFETSSWRKMSYNNWITSYKLNQRGVSLRDFESTSPFKGLLGLFWQGSALNRYLYRANILRDLRKEIASVITDDLRSLLSSEEYKSPTRGEILSYLNAIQQGSYYTNSSYGFKGINEPTEDGDLSGNFCLTTIIPNYDPSSNTFTAPISYTSLGYDPTAPNSEGDKMDQSPADGFKYLVRQNFTLYQEEDFDVKTIILKGLANYVKTALEGTGSDRYFVKYVKGDSRPSGRTNSLYYRRYLTLNNRLNTAEGTLASLFPVLRNKDLLDYSDDYTRNIDETYENIMEVVPISKYEELTWMPEQPATANTIAIPGKFYYQAELDALREQIGDQCVLTCTRCPVSDSCPFYNKEEIIKAYCTPAETLDLYFKDNELDLIAYTEEKRNAKGEIATPSYPDVWETSSDGKSLSSIDTDELKRLHSYYNDILKKATREEVETFEGQDLNDVRRELSASFSSEDFEDMGYLLGARYGTVQKNNLAMLANSDENFNEFNSKIPEYQYLYDALYIKDTETYFNYATGDKLYDVYFEKGPRGEKKKYKGKVKLKLPTSLKALNNANPWDDVYLISDDTKDGLGNPIVPIIYLGMVKNLQWSMGIIEDPSKSAQSSNDTNVYASDMAQWCINYYKGHCTEDPIGDINEDTSKLPKVLEEDRDQYWMEEIKKKVGDADGGSSWITLSGRPRISTGYQEPVVDPDNLSDVKIASGRPVVANYINFVRKFSIRIYDSSREAFDEAGNPLTNDMWTIPWVKDCGAYTTKTLSDGSKINWDTQRLALPYMKTNLRLVVVKN